MFDPASTPQFGKAEYLGTPSENRCRFCSQPVSQYYRVGGAIACGTCAEIARQQAPQENHSAFVRAVLFGIGGAAIGLIGYATLVIVLQGWTIGYISLGVGYVVGKAMMYGSGGIGGRRYQLAAALLTYAAVSMAAVPIAIALAPKHQVTQEDAVKKEQAQFEKEFGKQSQSQSQPEPEPEVAPKPSLGPVIWKLALLGLASPFLELGDSAWGVIGLVILFVGIRIAWRITAGRAPLGVQGPFDNSPPKPLPSS